VKVSSSDIGRRLQERMDSGNGVGKDGGSNTFVGRFKTSADEAGDQSKVRDLNNGGTIEKVVTEVVRCFSFLNEQKGDRAACVVERRKCISEATGG